MAKTSSLLNIHQAVLLFKTEHFSDATSPADTATTAAYTRLDGMVARYEEATNNLFTPGVDANPQAVADEVVRIVGRPAGTCPFRSLIDFIQAHVEEGNALLWKMQKDFLDQMGLGSVLTQIVPMPNEA